MTQDSYYDIDIDINTQEEIHINNPMEPSKKQKEFIQKKFPNINMKSVKILAKSSDRYNCIAWSLGIIYTWINPPSPLSNFGNLYLRAADSVHSDPFGLKWKAHHDWEKLKPLSDDGKIDGWGIKSIDKQNKEETTMIHASRILFCKTYPNGVWTSKLGEKYLITHNREGLKNKDYYGNVLVSFKQLVNSKIRNKIMARHFEAIKPSFFTEEENNILIQKVKIQEAKINERFLIAYQTWIEAIDEKIPFSSDTRDGAKLEEFMTLTDMGIDILPHIVSLIISDPIKNFRAVILYDALQKNDKLRIKYGPNDPNQLEGEISRAVRSAKLWLNQ